MISPKLLIDHLLQINYKTYTGTPCSYLGGLFNYINSNDSLKYIASPNEGDAVALAAGSYLAGNKAVVMFQNSGLGNAINPLTSLIIPFKLPFIGIMSIRGDIDNFHDEPQHKVMGNISTELLNLMDIEWQYLPGDESLLKNSIDYVDNYINKYKKPFFYIIKKGELSDFSINVQYTSKYELSRFEALKIINAFVSEQDIILTTTGKTSRELYAISDKSNQFYMVGSMGCVSAIANGISLGQFRNKIFVIDGDGSLMMRMSNLALTGQIKSNNLIHILLDNNCHDSTGGQGTMANQIDFCKIAQSCGYRITYNVDCKEKLAETIDHAIIENKLCFIRVYIKPGSIDNLPRPEIKPDVVANRLQLEIKKHS